ncbi:MAG: hypothetical protein GXZ04_04145 [Clostridiales bacterium]|nr:hypothetical protein [Clostridiales bacterium]
MDKKQEPGILDALFDINPEDESLVDLLLSPGNSDAPRKKKRPWQSDREECPNCGSMFPVGGVCPGCGLHDSEMPWGSNW